MIEANSKPRAAAFDLRKASFLAGPFLFHVSDRRGGPLGIVLSPMRVRSYSNHPILEEIAGGTVSRASLLHRCNLRS